MIGVISKPDQLQAVEEFFQLFKTPWEYYRPGEEYSVVLATTSEVPNIKARLLLVYCPNPTSVDGRAGIVPGKRLLSGCVRARDVLLPIYGEMRCLTAAQGTPCVAAGSEIVGVKIKREDATVIRLGYDLFDEVGFLLSNPQPVTYAHVPTLDIHICILRAWIVEQGISVLEIPPCPAGYSFVVCLTHDIDFIGIRQHRFDHTFWGFLYRSTVGAMRNLLRGRRTIRQLLQTWKAVLSLPFVYLGWVKDFWNPFDWYLKAEKSLPATYFLVPFKRRAGEHVPGPFAFRRATAYDVGDLGDWLATLKQQGCEVGLHGIDAWHNVERARAELSRINEMTGQSSTGVRMHWLLQDARTAGVLEESGFAYDATAGYNETVGYRNGTTQVFRPFRARSLLELPLHIQDGALFFPQQLDLTESEAQARCHSLIANASGLGGVLTLLWHDRSHGPERFWGDFYLGLLRTLRARNVWFGTAGQVVGWFQKRREVQFERVETPDGVRARVRYQGGEVQPSLNVRVYGPATKGRAATSDLVEVAWNGKSLVELTAQLSARLSAAVGDPALP